MSFLMSLDLDDFIQIIDKAIYRREELKSWQMWLMKYQHMDEKSFIPFSHFFKYQQSKQISKQRSAEEILKEAHEIRSRIRKKSGE
jgi:hypothetical protein